MENILTELLLPNIRTQSIYGVDKEFTRLVMSVELFGVLEPLKVFLVQDEKKYQVVSGNRRLSAAIHLSLPVVPCVICEPVEIDDDLVFAHQEQRVKLRSHQLLEITTLYDRYGKHLKQGKRNYTEEGKKAKKLRSALVAELGGKHVVNHYKTYSERAKLISKGEELTFKRELDLLDQAKSLRSAMNSQAERLADMQNASGREVFEFIHIPNVEIINDGSFQLKGILDNFVSLIFSSPPYFSLRDYLLGLDQLGQEMSVAEFVSRLASHFDECLRVLKPKGTLWVNISDCISDYQYQLVPEKFACAMVERGWMLHDKQIWLKPNVRWNTTPRSSAVHENIFVFKKEEQVNYNDSWTQDYHQDESGGFTYGKVGGKVKLRSIIDYRNGVVEAPVANNSALSKECQNQGVQLTHTATFPLTLPLIAVMSCTSPGDTILDIFSGTATTGEAVLRVGGGRRYIGYELNEDYLIQSKVRLWRAVNELESQGLAA
jgi:site-specific DNA-methyltransferase (adenine-specific)